MRCVLGFQHVIDDGPRSLPSNVDAQTLFRKHKTTAIAGKTGDLIIWHQSLSHGNRPNRAAVPCVVQCIDKSPMRPETGKN